jgi:hypothetical protein
MGVTIGKSNSRGTEEVDSGRFWDQSSRPRTKYMAVSDACWLYQDRELEQTLRRFGWRKARKEVLGHGQVKREWVGGGRGELRLGRKGLEIRFSNGTRVMGWKELQEFVRARRS